MRDDAEDALLSLVSSLVDEVAAARFLKLAGGLPALRDEPLTRRQLALAANRDEITPVRKAEKWCGFCGNVKADQLEPGPDQEFGHRREHDWICRDEYARQCHARHMNRYPPDPSRPLPELMEWARQRDEADEAEVRRKVAAARPAAGEDLAGLDESQGNRAGQQVPLPVRVPAYPHTIAGGAYRGHLLSGQARPHYLAGPNYIPVHLYDSEGHQDGQEAAPVPEASEAEMGRQDVYQAARAAAPQQPGRTYRRDMYGRRHFRRR